MWERSWRKNDPDLYLSPEALMQTSDFGAALLLQLRLLRC